MKSTNATYRVGNENFEIKIGSHPDCKIFLDSKDYSGVDPDHVLIKRVGDRIFIKDVSFKSKVEWGICEFDLHGHEKHRIFESGNLPIKQWCEIIFDDLEIGQDIAIILKGVTHTKTRNHAKSIKDLPIKLDRLLFQSRPRLKIETTPLDFEIKGKGKFCNGAYIRANPGTVTAIMGPSGCGKSTLLRMLTGYYSPTNTNAGIKITDDNGKVFDLEHDKTVVRDFLGYVPQGDVVFSDLTPSQSLNYTLQLWSPQKNIPTEGIIHYTSKRLGFDGDQFDQFLHTKMGSPEIEGGNILSGGQRRRANIAHSLVTQPLILILDEPTTGLSSVDSDHIARLLQKLAKEQGLAIITTIHQPGRDVFDCFDDLLLMTYGGNICYYGTAKEAVGYFEKTTGVVQGNKNPAEYLLEQVSDNKVDSQNMKNVMANFERDKSTLSYLRTPLTQNVKSPINRREWKISEMFPSIYDRLINCLTLVQRNLCLMMADKFNLGSLFGQVPVLALLIFLAFYQFTLDEHDFGVFSQRTHVMNSLLEKDRAYNNISSDSNSIYERTDEAVRSENIERNKSGKPVLLGQPTAQRRASIYFLIVAASIWFGVMNACKEIVTEKAIILREMRSYVEPSSYILAKIITQTLVVCLQTGILAVISGPLILGLPVVNILWLWAILIFTSITATGLGLLISAIAPTLSFALTMVPLIVMPQFIYGGIMRPEVNLKEESPVKAFNSLTIQRWGFEAALAIDTYTNEGVLKRSDITWPTNESNPYSSLQVIQFENTSLVKSFFEKGGILRPLTILFTMGFLFLLSSYLVLRWRFT